MCELSPVTRKRSTTLLLKSGFRTLLTIYSSSMFEAVTCSSLSPRYPAPFILGALRER